MKSDILSSDVDLEQQKPDDNNNDSENSSYDDKSADDVLGDVVTMAEDKTDKDYFSSPSQSSACPTSSSLANDFDDMQDFYGTGTAGSLRSSYSLGSGSGNSICRPTMISGKYRQKEERRKMLKVSMNKLRRIDDPESSLRRSVLINNTVRRLQREAREEKLQKSQSVSACSGSSIVANSPSQSKCFGITNDFITKQQEDNLKNSSDELSFLTASTIGHRGASDQLLAITSLHDNPSTNKSARSSSPTAHSSSSSPVASSSSSSGSAAVGELTSNGNEDDERIIVQSIAQDFDLPSPLELSTTSPTSNITTDSASLVTSTISSSSSCPSSSSSVGSLSSSTVSSVQPHHHHHNHHHHHHHQQQQQPNRKRSIEDNESSLVDDCDVVLNQFYLQACAVPSKMLSALDEDEDEDVNVVDIDTSPPISVDLVDHHHSSSIKRRRLMSPSDCCKTAADRLRDNISSSSPLLMPPLVADDWSSSMIDDDAAAVFMQPNLLSSANCMSHAQPALTATTSPHQSANFSCGHSSLLNEIVVYHNLIASLES